MPLDREARRLAGRYYGAMLSAAAVAAVLGAASAYLAGSADLLPGLLAWIAAVLIGVNFAGVGLKIERVSAAKEAA